jgi:hypothetical protein
MFKIITQFCNFTISLIDTKESFHLKPMKSNIQQQNRIFPLRLEDDTFCFNDYTIIVQQNKTILNTPVQTTEGGKCNINSNDINFLCSSRCNTRSYNIEHMRFECSFKMAIT